MREGEGEGEGVRYVYGYEKGQYIGIEPTGDNSEQEANDKSCSVRHAPRMYMYLQTAHLGHARK